MSCLYACWFSFRVTENAQKTAVRREKVSVCGRCPECVREKCSGNDQRGELLRVAMTARPTMGQMDSQYRDKERPDSRGV